MGFYRDGLDVIGAIAGLGITIFIIYVLLLIGAAVISYYIFCVPQEKIARKTGAGSPWMAYVPVARNIQRMRIAKMPLWKMFFVGSAFTVCLAMGIILLVTIALSAIHSTLGGYMGVLMILAYMVLNIVFTYEYNLKICGIFDYDNALALIWLFSPVELVFTYIIAFSNKVQPVGTINEKKSIIDVVKDELPVSIGLEGVSGIYAGAKFDMQPTDTFVIGRDGTLSNIIISYEKVSKRHCSIRYLVAEGYYEVTDFSTNGTFYGNTRLTKDIPVKLRKGTIIAIGDKENQFMLK